MFFRLSIMFESREFDCVRLSARPRSVSTSGAPFVARFRLILIDAEWHHERQSELNQQLRHHCQLGIVAAAAVAADVAVAWVVVGLDMLGLLDTTALAAVHMMDMVVVEQHRRDEPVDPLLALDTLDMSVVVDKLLVGRLVPLDMAYVSSLVVVVVVDGVVVVVVVEPDVAVVLVIDLPLLAAPGQTPYT